MEKIKDIVLESEVAILTGGVDLDGVPMLTFPTDAGDLVDMYGSGSILQLLQFYVRVAGGSVAVLADLQHGWTPECITKLTVLLDELQMSIRHCLKTVYLVKPRVQTKQRFLFRELSRKYGPGRMVPHYKVTRLECHEDLYDYVDQSQLTTDYGGTLDYNHTAWVDFQKLYMPIIKDAENLLNTMPSIKHGVNGLPKSDNKPEVVRQDIEAKYEGILSKWRVRETLDKCRRSLADLENTSYERNYIQIHASFLVNTTNKLRQLTTKIASDIEELDSLTWTQKPSKDTLILKRIKQCEENANEVIETIILLNEQVKELPNVGNCLTEAVTNRHYFLEEILKPSKEIVGCSTVILKQLDAGKETTPKSYAASFEVAKQLTEALQPFTQEINKLNDTYTRVHLFFMLLEKVQRWKDCACSFIMKTHNDSTLHKTKQHDDRVHRTDSKSEQLKLSFNELPNDQCSSPSDNCTASKLSKPVFKYPDGWTGLLTKFLSKHPPPKKRHLRLLTRNVPEGIQTELKDEANDIVERTVFILTLLDKSCYKTEDVALILQWHRDTHGTVTCLDAVQNNELDVTCV